MGSPLYTSNKARVEAMESTLCLDPSKEGQGRPCKTGRKSEVVFCCLFLFVCLLLWLFFCCYLFCLGGGLGGGGVGEGMPMDLPVYSVCFQTE